MWVRIVSEYAAGQTDIQMIAVAVDEKRGDGRRKDSWGTLSE